MIDAGLVKQSNLNTGDVTRDSLHKVMDWIINQVLRLFSQIGTSTWG